MKIHIKIIGGLTGKWLSAGILAILGLIVMPGGNWGMQARAGEDINRRLEIMMKEMRRLKENQARQQAEIERQKKLIARQQKLLESRKWQAGTARRKMETAAGQIEPPLHTSALPSSRTVSSSRKNSHKNSRKNSGAAVVAGERPGSFRLPGSKTSIRIGGYVKGDAIYSLDHDVGDFFISSSIPTGSRASRRNRPSFRAHARQTRLQFQSWTPTRWGEFKTRVEGDFVGGGGVETFGNSSTFRLRHAYGELGPLLVGQTWSAFMDLNAYPATVDFFGPTGIPFVRQGQVRLTIPADEKTRLLFSAENSEMAAHADGHVGADGIAANAAISSESAGLRLGIDVVPDFVMAIKHGGEWGSLSVAGLVRVLSTDSGQIPNDQAVGWGTHLSGHLNLGGKDKLAGGIAIGEGIGRYLSNGAFTSSDATIDTESGRISPDLSWGAYGFLRHYWSPLWSSNLVYGHEQHEDAVAGVRQLDTVHANIFYTPLPRAKLGLEYVYGHRRDVNGDSGEASRLQFGAWWYF